jgi:hypothetical protein
VKRAILGGAVLIAIGACLGRGWERLLCALLGHAHPERVQKAGRWLHCCSRCGVPANLGSLRRGHDLDERLRKAGL